MNGAGVQRSTSISGVLEYFELIPFARRGDSDIVCEVSRLQRDKGHQGLFQSRSLVLPLLSHQILKITKGLLKE